MPHDDDQIVTNLRGQAVELHLAGRVVVIPPHGQAPIRAHEDDVFGHVHELARRRLVGVHAASPGRPSTARKATKAAKRTTAKKATSKKATSKKATSKKATSKKASKAAKTAKRSAPRKAT